MGGEVDSVRVSGACKKVVLVDNDKSGDDMCSDTSPDNEYIEGEGERSDLPFDIEEDVCAVIIIVKEAEAPESVPTEAPVEPTEAPALPPSDGPSVGPVEPPSSGPSAGPVEPIDAPVEDSLAFYV